MESRIVDTRCPFFYLWEEYICEFKNANTNVAMLARDLAIIAVKLAIFVVDIISAPVHKTSKGN